MLIPSKTTLITSVAAIAIVGFLWLSIDTLSARNEMLTAELRNAKATSQARKNIITQYSSERAYMTTLLTKRQQRANKTQEKLRNDIKAMEASMADDACLSQPWPSAVIERLHEPY
ncbi:MULTISPECIES: hypothetical protein [Salinivibrio]|uniref:DUF2570 domain-containing protein n=1 Tax=Salinivibrio proteolyticus TaxID=334715 RepID=A0ABY7LHR8_9GAMM|nr:MULTISPECIES: hypothetical protein [Salinivibrio]WBA16182.1 hypothetical protein N7E60_08935 [Salinivibrio proteolyticus]